MEKKDLKNLLENIYHLLAEQDGWPPGSTPPPPPWPPPIPTGPGMLDPNWEPWHPPMLPPDDSGWTDGPEPIWQSPLSPDYVAPQQPYPGRFVPPPGFPQGYDAGNGYHVIPQGTSTPAQTWRWNPATRLWVLIKEYPFVPPGPDPAEPTPFGPEWWDWIWNGGRMRPWLNGGEQGEWGMRQLQPWRNPWQDAE
jgi:hypothetical protein